MEYIEENPNNFEQISTKLAQFGIRVEMQGNHLFFTAFLTTLEILKKAKEVFKNELKLTFTA